MTEDRRGDPRFDYGDTATRTTVGAWVQQTGAAETFTDSRDDRTTRYTMFSTETPSLTALDRIEWDDLTFSVDGSPNHLDTPRGYHHTEAHLLLVEG